MLQNETRRQEVRVDVTDVNSLTLTRGSSCSGTRWAMRALLRVFRPPEESVRQAKWIRSDLWIGQTEDDGVWLLRH